MNNKQSKDVASQGGGDAGLADNAESKTGIKTIDRLSELPVVSTALTNVTDYYEKVKEKNLLFRTSLNLAELSVKTMAFAATPLTSLCKKPSRNATWPPRRLRRILLTHSLTHSLRLVSTVSSVDMYLCDKVEQLENSYPLIGQPTDQVNRLPSVVKPDASFSHICFLAHARTQLTATAISQAKDIYDRTVKSPIDSIDKKVTDIKNYGSNKVNARSTHTWQEAKTPQVPIVSFILKVQAVVKAGSDSIDSLRNYGYDQLNKSADLGVRMVDACLENKLAKMFTDPVLDFTEKSLNYLIPTLVESDASKCKSKTAFSRQTMLVLSSRLNATRFTQKPTRSPTNTTPPRARPLSRGSTTSTTASTSTCTRPRSLSSPKSTSSSR